MPLEPTEALPEPLPLQPTDGDLIRQCLDGNTEAFRGLYQRYQGIVRATLHQLCDAEALDDLTQEVFLRTWRGLPRFRQSARFSTWIYRITWNVATDCRRQRGRSRSQRQGLPPLATTDHAAPDWLTLHYQDLVQRGLQQLNWQHRSVVVLHDLEQLPQKEVAAILDIPVGTVKSRLHHGRITLRQFLQREGVQL